MTDKKENEEEFSSTGKGIVQLVILALLVWWRGPGFVDDIKLFTGGETVVATMESKRTVARNDVFYFYFLAEGDTVRNESGMFYPLMAMTSRDNEDDVQVFKVVYDPAEPQVNFPRATLRIHFLISLILLLLAAFYGVTAVGNFRGKF